MNSNQHDRLQRAYCTLEGLSVGDAFGERFFVHPDVVQNLVAMRAIPNPPWAYTDDTEMALSIVAILRQHEQIDQTALAQSFAERYNPSCGYGPAMHGLLRRIRQGEQWQTVATSLFAGQGSYGNGAAMRVAPLGAYFADDIDLVVDQTRRSAEVTHMHPEGIAGAIAIAAATAFAWRLRDQHVEIERGTLLDQILPLVPDSEVRMRLRWARDLAPDTPVQTAAAVLGNGSGISAQDTVPFVLWCASQHLYDYEAALWATVSGLGDIDTTCAMVGGIVASIVGVDGIPAEWRTARESLPNWPFHDTSAETVTLYRPVGPKELALIAESWYQAFPPRRPDQPIFYPVLNEEYAAAIARNWNARNPSTGYTGYVTRFHVRAAFLERYSVQIVGNSAHAEYWIPAEDLADLNGHIVGPIEVIDTFGADLSAKA